MSEENDNGPVIRYLTNARFKATRDHDPEKAAATDQQKPANMPGVFVMVGLLVAGVAGVMVIGPEKTANAARNLMSSRKAPAEDVAKESDPEIETKPDAPTIRKRQNLERAASRRKTLRTGQLPGSVPATALPQGRLHMDAIRPGMLRRELLELCGAPDMKTITSERGHLVENFTYTTPSRSSQTVVLEDGRVVATGAN